LLFELMRRALILGKEEARKSRRRKES